MKIEETKNSNIKIVMNKKEARELYANLNNKSCVSGVELDLWDVLYTNSHILND